MKLWVRLDDGTYREAVESDVIAAGRVFDVIHETCHRCGEKTVAHGGPYCDCDMYDGRHDKPRWDDDQIAFLKLRGAVVRDIDEMPAQEKRDRMIACMKRIGQTREQLIEMYGEERLLDYESRHPQS